MKTPDNTTHWLIVNDHTNEYIEYTSKTETENLYISLFKNNDWTPSQRIHWVTTQDPSRFIAREIREKYTRRN
jgi:hypothetical protein